MRKTQTTKSDSKRNRESDHNYNKWRIELIIKNVSTKERPGSYGFTGKCYSTF